MHVIVGAGAVGSAIASLLAAEGEQVRIVTRSGGGPAHPLIERIAGDATDATELSRIAAGAKALYNCANPLYHKWPTDWPPLASALLAAAESSGAPMVITGNLYAYGPVDRPMTPDLPLAASTVKGGVRQRMWNDALAAHRAGRIRVTEARASDFIALRHTLLETVLPALRAGRRTVRLPLPLDVPHTFTYTVDVARTMITLARDDRAFGRAWHVPSPPPVTARELVRRAAAAGGFREPKVTRYFDPLVRMSSWFNPFTREFLEMRYQFERPFVLDSSQTQEVFGLRPTDLDEALRATLRSADGSR
jgi:nucleoside-diphosphate-sugar epimerase